MRRPRHLLLGLSLAPLSAFGQTWNAANDFSASSNPSGAWSYHMAPSVAGPRTLLGFQQSSGGLDFWRASSDPYPASFPAVLHNPSGSTLDWGADAELAPGQLVMHPGDTENVVVRWTAPTAGAYRLTGLFGSVHTEPGTSADVRVLVAGVQRHSAYLVGTVGSTTPPFDETVSLASGETVDFVGGFGGDSFERDGIAVDATIQAVPEPASLAALGLGLVTVARRKRAR